jgi:hypothetical protein
MRTIAVVSIMFATLLLCANGADAAPWCAQYGTGGTNCGFHSFELGCAVGERRILLSEFIRGSVLDRRGLAKAVSTLLEKQSAVGVSRKPRPF